MQQCRGSTGHTLARVAALPPRLSASQAAAWQPESETAWPPETRNEGRLGEAGRPRSRLLA